MSSSSCFQKAKQSFLKMDFFCATQFLRYKAESEYATCTGAVCSVIIVATFLAIFMNVLIDTINRTIITYNMNTIDQSANPLSISTSVRGNNKFMFAVAVAGFDLNDPTTRYFDVTLTLIESVNKVKTKVKIDLVPCNIGNWNISTDIQSAYNRMGFDELLCVPQNVSMSLQGKFSQDIFNYAQLEISKCNNTLDPSRPCANDSYILSKLAGNSFYTNFYFINSLINPNNENPISYYLQDRNYILFNYNFGGLVNLFISKYEITTDNSIWPIEDSDFYEGGYSRDLGQSISFQNDGITLAQFFIRRASTNIQVTREYIKLDSTLSYIGGLFGFIMTALLFMAKYTECSYQIEVGGHLYEQDHDKSIDKQNFNLFWYLVYLLHWILTSIGFELEWKRMKSYDDCREEISKQFDVCFLFERINFLQRSFPLLFSEDQYKLLHLQKKLTLKQAIEQRQRYEYLQKLKEQTCKEKLQKTEQNINPLELQNLQSSPTRNYNKNTEINEQPNSSSSISHFKKGMKLLKKKSMQGDLLSKKIIQNVDRTVANRIEQCMSESQNNEALPEIVQPLSSKKSNSEQIKQAVPLCLNLEESQINHFEGASENVIKVEPEKKEQGDPFTYL